MCLGIPGQIVDIVDPAQHRAVADVDGVRREVSTALLTAPGGEGLELGEWVLIHVGFAMAKIDEAEATETLAQLRMLGEAFDDEIAQLQGDFSAALGPIANTEAQ